MTLKSLKSHWEFQVQFRMKCSQIIKPCPSRSSQSPSVCLVNHCLTSLYTLCSWYFSWVENLGASRHWPVSKQRPNALSPLGRCWGWLITERSTLYLCGNAPLLTSSSKSAASRSLNTVSSSTCVNTRKGLRTVRGLSKHLPFSAALHNKYLEMEHVIFELCKYKKLTYLTHFFFN